MGQESEKRDWKQEFNEGSVKIEDLPQDELARLSNGEYEVTEDSSNLTSETTPEVVSEPAAVENKEVPPTDPAAEESWYKKKNYEISNDLNRERQLKEGFDWKMKNDPLFRENYLKEQGIVLTPSASTPVLQPNSNEDLDVYDEGVLRDMHTTMNATVKELKDLKASIQSDRTATTVKTQRSALVQSIEQTQAKHPGLQTDMPFHEINMLVENGNTSPEALKAHGVSDSDYAKMKIIYDVNNSSTMVSTNNFDYAYYNSQHNTPSQVAQTNANDPLAEVTNALVEKKLTEIKQMTPTMDAPRGSQSLDGQENNGMSVEQVAAFFEKHRNSNPHDLSPADKQTYDIAMKAIGAT